MKKADRKVRDGAVALVAFGGNVIHKPGETGTIRRQAANARRMCRRLADMVERGYGLVVTHGNGPQVGNLLMQNELARELVPQLPLDVLVAQTEGSLGHILQLELSNELRRRDLKREVVTILTEVEVAPRDAAFRNPTKPVGPFYSRAEAQRLAARFPGWRMVEDGPRGYRRLVPSPMPRRILQSGMVRSLVYAGHVVLALGGGGIPIALDRRGRATGVEAVIDKDLSSAMLALDVKADLFVILTGVERVCLNFGKKDQQPLDRLTHREATAHMQAGAFPAGNMGPKIAAALMYLEGGGREVIVTDPAHLAEALEGRAGTSLVWR